MADLTQEREAEIRARLSAAEDRWPETSLLEQAAIDLRAEIDRLRAALADAEARGRDAGLREAARGIDRYRHHALWGDLLDYQWDERTEHFVRSLVARMRDGILLSLIGKPPADGWLPIETAPKRGVEWILLSGFPGSPDKVTCGYWGPAQYDRRTRDYVMAWCRMQGTYLVPQPTRWQPLPPPPKGGDNG